jgi:hypothetical protein
MIGVFEKDTDVMFVGHTTSLNSGAVSGAVASVALWSRISRVWASSGGCAAASVARNVTVDCIGRRHAKIDRGVSIKFSRYPQPHQHKIRGKEGDPVSCKLIPSETSLSRIG